MNMAVKQKMVFLSAIGFALGVIVGTVITAVTATLSLNDGTLYVCAPEFTAVVGNPITAYAIQAVLSGVIGMVGMGGSAIYSVEEWSLVKVTVIHFLGCNIVLFTSGLYLRWFSLENIGEILITFFIMFVIYVIIWLSQYLSYKHQISEINRELQEWKLAK